MKKILLFIVSILMFAVPTTACMLQKSDETLIRERIDSFLTAYNTGDLEAVLDCLDAKTRNTFKSTIELSQALGGTLLGVSGINIADLFGAGVGIMSEGEMLKVDIKEIVISGDKATVTVMMSYEDNFNSISDEAFFTMLKENGNWYIKNFEDK